MGGQEGTTNGLHVWLTGVQFLGAHGAWEACLMRKPLIAVLAVLASTSALAQPTDHRHLGFFVRLNGGLGFIDSSADGAEVSGFAGDLGVAVGGAVAENLVLSGSLWGVNAVSPTASYQGQTAILSGSTFGLGMIAPELTYYFMPANLYLSGAAGIGRLNENINGNADSSDYGPAVRASVGKEWWVSRHWGVGLAGHMLFMSNGDGAAQVTWATWHAAVTFSATYN